MSNNNTLGAFCDKLQHPALALNFFVGVRDIVSVMENGKRRDYCVVEIDLDIDERYYTVPLSEFSGMVRRSQDFIRKSFEFNEKLRADRLPFDSYPYEVHFEPLFETKKNRNRLI